MTTCRECSAQVSSTAKACPSCGVSHPDAKQAKAAGSASYIVAGLLVIVGLVVAFVLVDMLSSAMT